MSEPTPSSTRSPGWSRWDSVKVVLVVLLGVFLLVADPPADSPGREASAGMADLPSSGDRARRDGSDRCRAQDAADSARVSDRGVLAFASPTDRIPPPAAEDRRCSQGPGAATRDGDR